MLDPDLLMKIDKGKLPRHIAIVMDGNGRWAQRRVLPRHAGHRAGVMAVDDVVTTARKLGVSCLTLYALSTENWSRPRQEIRALMGILKIYLRKELRRMVRENIRFNAIGRIQDLPTSIQSILCETMAQTSQNDAMIFTLALSYGSRMEIINAVQHLVHAVQRGELRPRGDYADSVQQFLVYRRLARSRSVDSDWWRTTFEQFSLMANLLY